MCFPSAPKDNSAAIARQSEAQRQGRIRQGTEAINQQFAGFNDDYYNSISQSALDFYNPDLTKQYDNTRESVIKNLARSGNLQGSVGANKLKELEEEKARQSAMIADRASGFAQNARADVNQNRANLLNQLSATADPNAAATAAAAAAQSLTAPPQFSPIGNLFADFTNNAATQVGAARQGYENPASILFGVGKPASGSSRVVA